MKKSVFLGTAVLVLAGQAHATLLGVVQNYPDTTATTGPQLYYDHDGVDANTGLLLLVAGSSTLAEGAAAGGSSTNAQSYFGSGDSVGDILVSIAVRNGNGGYTAGSFVSGAVDIDMGNSTTATRWSWDGAVTNFGFQAGSGTIFDATWTVTADAYQNMPTAMSQFVNGYLTGGSGGIKITSSVAWGSTMTFGNDWVLGQAATTNSPTYNAYSSSLTNPVRTVATVTGDIFASPVPEPEQALLLLAGLAALAPVVRRQRRQA